MARILVVDDDDTNRRLCWAILKEYGHLACTFYDAELALNHLLENRHHYDLLLTDLEMPKMQGDELSNRVREHFPDLPIIMMSGGEVPMEHSADIFLSKPFHAQELPRIIDSLLKK